jgi:hypothetical protein
MNKIHNLHLMGGEICFSDRLISKTIDKYRKDW